MSHNFLIEIAPDVNNQLRVNLKGDSLAAAGLEFLRPPFQLSEPEIAELRRGDAQPALVQQVEDRLHHWLVVNGIGPYVAQNLPGPAIDRLRLVFSINERLEATLADVPIELLEVNGDILALRPDVDIVHLLPRTSAAQGSVAPPDWPLRILIVRSNPGDLGGAVPAATPMCDYIQQIGNQQGPALVRIDLLSNEPGATQPPTWEALREQLRKVGYHVLVYLGHGDLVETFVGLPPSGVLQLESSDGQTHVSVSSEQLKYALQNRPVPAVLLVGCLTAAQVPANIRALIDQELPRWMRGSQGVAQALVNSQGGPQFAVGMRYRLDDQAAEAFLRAFFRSLIELAPGDLEAAVRSGRRELHAISPYPPSWSAPVIFRSPGEEPTFPFLARLPALPPDPADERDQSYRQSAWSALVQLPRSTRRPESEAFPREVLAEAERRLIERAVGKGAAVLIIGDAEAQPNQLVKVQIRLHGQLDVRTVEGKLLATTQGVTFQSLTRTQALKDSGFHVLAQVDGGEVFFRIVRDGIMGNAILPEGPLFEATLSVGEAFSVIYQITLEHIETEPQRIVRSFSNAILVPPP